MNTCPFHTAQDLIQEGAAGIIFVTYPYLFDPSVHNITPPIFEGSIVIVDEAHNVASTCREAGTYSITADKLKDQVSDLVELKGLLEMEKSTKNR